MFVSADPSSRGGLRRESAAARFLGMRVGIPPGSWMPVSFQCCVSSGKRILDELWVKGLCVGLTTPPEKACRAWWFWVWWWILDNEEALTHQELSRNTNTYCLLRVKRALVSLVIVKINYSRLCLPLYNAFTFICLFYLLRVLCKSWLFSYLNANESYITV
jgi:hypothetical protein